MSKHLGITGTRDGMNEVQRKMVADELKRMKNKFYGIFHHGDCLGVDVQAALMAYDLDYVIYCHPPDKAKNRGFFKLNTVTFDKKPYLERDRDIVNAVDFLIAVPNTVQERMRSGTWATVRMAQLGRVDHVVLLPDSTRLVRDYSVERTRP